MTGERAGSGARANFPADSITKMLADLRFAYIMLVGTLVALSAHLYSDGEYVAAGTTLFAAVCWSVFVWDTHRKCRAWVRILNVLILDPNYGRRK